MPNVLLQGRIAADNEANLSRFADPEWQINVWDPAKHPVEAFAPLAEEADVIIGGNIPIPHWPQTPNLKLFQVPWTGVNFTEPGRMPNGIAVCNCFGHEVPIAEYVMLAILEWQIGLRTMDARWRQKGWDGHYAGSGVFHGEVQGTTVGIVGYGHIGEAVATRAAAFGMRVIGVRRSEQPTPALLDWLGTLAQLDQLLEESDFVVLACPLTDETQNLIDAQALGKLGVKGVLINVARGGVVVEDDLFAALQARSIGGAVLDVWYNYNSHVKPEVWPSNHPFQGLDNVILTAHESAWTREQIERRWEFVAANIRRALAGETEHNWVFTGSAPAVGD